MCGIFGIFSEEREAAPDCYIGLYALQHRGKESARIVTSNDQQFYEEGGMGEIPAIFPGESLRRFSGKIGIAHNRYSTTSSSDPQNIQPIQEFWRGEEFWLAHNGNLVNAEEIRRECFKRGKAPAAPSDSGAIATLISLSSASSFEEAVRETVERLRGAFSILILRKDELIALRDQLGIRPLHLGQRRNDFILASETCAFSHLEAKPIREIKAGEILRITKSGLKEYHQFPVSQMKKCLFEYIYFQRPDSLENKRRIYEIREKMGQFLAQEQPAKADLAIPVPDSGIFGGIGFIKESGIEDGREALFRPHLVSRTFIEPIQELREKGTELKLVILEEKVRGKRVVIIDDSIVRGTTTKRLVDRLRRAGVKEVHLRIHSPPYRYPCYFGIDTYRAKDELLAARCQGDVEKIKNEIGADSLGYLSLESVIRAIIETPGEPLAEDGFCTACFDGQYPIEIKGS